MLINAYQQIRERTVQLCLPLQTEDYVVQPVVDVSPPKWHLGHSTWFFEAFILKPYLKNYQEFDPDYNYIFNSYYENAGAHVMRTDRGNLSRPTVQEVYHYRQHVDEAMRSVLQHNLSHEVEELVGLGLNHEQQHQELLLTDIKYILGHNPLFPAYKKTVSATDKIADDSWITIPKGIYEIGFKGNGFCFDNELAPHNVWLSEFAIQKSLVTNKEYIEFINDGGYENFRFWHTDGWDWVKGTHHKSPLYWHHIDGKWLKYELSGGLISVVPEDILCHINFYEASAFAAWKGFRLPTEFEWEIAAEQLDWGTRWEWTNSAYLPYPGYTRAEGAIGEYNGKFMVNQMVLRGASLATPSGHSRISYRNFFHPHLQWQFTGIRLAK
ncbi:MAG TPA: ergothioneine biosynthesis protein EgtB [Sphingobacteriaceae bacterium]